MQFEQLLTRLTETHQALQHHARKTVDSALVLRNWLFGCFLVEYEQGGEDRATYGQRLLPETAKRLKQAGISGMSATSLRLCRLLYLAYPQIHQTLSDEFRISLPTPSSKTANSIIRMPASSTSISTITRPTK